MKLLFKERKSCVLSPSTLRCLNDTYTLNPTSGCVHLCSYCYARGYSNYPGDGIVVLYSNIAKKLEDELDRKRKLPSFVYFSPSCDVFQPVKEVLDTTFCLMNALLERGIGVSFLTKGHITEKFMALFKKYNNIVQAHIGITTLNSRIQRLLEPHAAIPIIRLKNISSLINIGIMPEIRLDPLIPCLTDSDNNIDSLFKILGGLGVRSVGLNYLFLRPKIQKNLRNTLSNTRVSVKVFEAFYNSVDLSLLTGQPASQSRTVENNGCPDRTVCRSGNSMVVALNLQFRERGYGRITSHAGKYGIMTHVCGCKNPDVTKELACRDIWNNYFDKRKTVVNY